LLISKGAVKQLFPSNNNKDMLFKILYFKYKNPIKFKIKLFFIVRNILRYFL